MISDAENMDANAYLGELADMLRDREWWTYAEALYWLAFRNVDRVAERVGDGSEWKGQQASFIRACFLADLEAMAGLEAEIAASEGKPHDAWSGSNAQALLLDRLRRGKIKARGRFEGRGKAEDIPADEWGDLTLDDGPGLPATVNAWHARHKGDPAKAGVWWSDVVFSRDGLMSAFPPMILAATGPKEPASQNETADTRPEWAPRGDRDQETDADWLRRVGRKLEQIAWDELVEEGDPNPSDRKLAARMAKKVAPYRMCTSGSICTKWREIKKSRRQSKK